jgi:hypothetical protein
MALLDYVVRFGASNTLLNDVQGINLSAGRQWLVDPYQAGTCQIVCRNIAAWTTAPKMKNEIGVTVEGSVVFKGYITDVKINYGIVTALDEAVITCEGPLALLGRRNLRSLALAQGLTGDQAQTIFSTVNVVGTASETYSIASAQTYTGNALQALNGLAQTELGRVSEVIDDLADPALIFYGRNTYSDEGVYYTTLKFDTTGSSSLFYDEIEFSSTAENYYTRVTAEPLGLTAQTTNSGSAPFYSLDIDTYDYSTSQASSLTQYLISQFANNDSEITAISATYALQTTASSQTMFRESFICGRVAGQAEIVFRGTTYYAVIEGYTVTATPDATRVTWYLSPQDLNNYLKWSNPSPYNKWDYNKWGF